MLKSLAIISVFMLLRCSMAAQRRISISGVNEKIFEMKDRVKRQAEITFGKNEHCATWEKNGFCENTFYPLEFRERWCGFPCGLCAINESNEPS